MAKKGTRVLHQLGPLQVDEKGRLFYDDREIVLGVKPSGWINFAIILASISTALYAIVTVLAYLKIYIL
jgi:hypothetical protein